MNLKISARLTLKTSSANHEVTTFAADFFE